MRVGEGGAGAVALDLSGWIVVVKSRGDWHERESFLRVHRLGAGVALGAILVIAEAAEFHGAFFHSFRLSWSFVFEGERREGDTGR